MARMKGRVGGSMQMRSAEDCGVVFPSRVIKQRKKGWKKLVAQLGKWKARQRELKRLDAIAARPLDVRPRLVKKPEMAR